MSNGKLLTLFLDHENELRATMPDFAHQLSELLNVPPKKIDYSNKAVAEYEVPDAQLENSGTEEEEELEFHEDFEQNIMFLMDQTDDSMRLVFQKHFKDDDGNRENMMAQLADNFTNESIQKMFERESDMKDDLLSTYISHCGVEKKKKKTYLEQVDTETKTHCGVEKKKKKNQFIQIQFCESCDAEHADHFRLCDICNEEHDGCCEVYA